MMMIPNALPGGLTPLRCTQQAPIPIASISPVASTPVIERMRPPHLKAGGIIAPLAPCAPNPEPGYNSAFSDQCPRLRMSESEVRLLLASTLPWPPQRRHPNCGFLPPGCTGQMAKNPRTACPVSTPPCTCLVSATAQVALLLPALR